MSSTDFMPLEGWDHVELWVGNAKQAAYFYEHAFGFTPTAYGGPETGMRDPASYVLEQGEIRLVVTSGLRADSEVTQYACRHGDAAKGIALQVPSAGEAYRQGGQRGGRGVTEPHRAEGKRKSQIEEYLEFNHGPGVQHIALQSEDIVRTVEAMKERGVLFLDTPDTYYEDVQGRVGEIGEDYSDLQRLKILADRDEDGYLLQIFTKTAQDRPTVFFEVIERHGATTFGEGNFKALFESIEREQALRGNL